MISTDGPRRSRGQNDADVRVVQFYAITSADKGVGGQIVEAVVGATPTGRLLAVPMDLERRILGAYGARLSNSASVLKHRALLFGSRPRASRCRVHMLGNRARARQLNGRFGTPSGRCSDGRHRPDATRSGHPHEPLGGVRKFHTRLAHVSFESEIKIALANPVASATGRRPPASSTPLLPRYVHR